MRRLAERAVIYQIVIADKKMRQYNKYIAGTAENSSRTVKVLIISWVYRYNCTNINLSKNATNLRYMY